MKQWKYILIGSIITILAYLGGVTYYVIEAINYKGIYPYPTIAGEVNNWFDRFIVESWLTVFPFTPIFVIAIVLVIISIKRLKKK